MAGEHEHEDEGQAQGNREHVVNSALDWLPLDLGTGGVDALGRGLAAAGGALEAGARLAADRLGDLAGAAAGVAGDAVKAGLEAGGNVDLGGIASAAGEAAGAAGEVLGAAGEVAGAVIEGLGSISS